MIRSYRDDALCAGRKEGVKRGEAATCFLVSMEALSNTCFLITCGFGRPPAFRRNPHGKRKNPHRNPHRNPHDLCGLRNRKGA